MPPPKKPARPATTYDVVRFRDMEQLPDRPQCRIARKGDDFELATWTPTGVRMRTTGGTLMVPWAAISWARESS